VRVGLLIVLLVPCSEPSNQSPDLHPETRGKIEMPVRIITALLPGEADPRSSGAFFVGLCRKHRQFFFRPPFKIARRR